MATRVAKRPIGRRTAVNIKKAKGQPAEAISAVYDLAERFVDIQREFLQGLIEAVTKQFAQRPPKGQIATKPTRTRRATRKHEAKARAAKKAA